MTNSRRGLFVLPCVDGGWVGRLEIAKGYINTATQACSSSTVHKQMVFSAELLDLQIDFIPSKLV